MTYVILTATLEQLGAGTSHINATRNWNLAKRLNANQLEFVSATGFYKGVDQGDCFKVFCPHPANVECVLAIARGFSQESVIVDGALVFVTGPRAGQRVESIGCITGEEAKQQDGYTRINHSGKCFSYVFPPGTF